MAAPLRVRLLGGADLDLIRRIDRSEHVDVEYEVVEGRLRERPVTIAEVPPWESAGDGPHSVAAMSAFCRQSLARGGQLLGAYVGEEVAGVAVVEPRFEPPMAWLAFLHVSRPFRRSGVGSALWRAAVELAVGASATRLYVSATPAGSAVNFYLGQGSRLAEPPHPGLFALEPEDIHLVCALRSGSA